MTIPRALAVTLTTAALAAAPLATAVAANAAVRPASTTTYLVAVEHCGGGLAARSYPTLRGATRADAKAVRHQHAHPLSVRTVSLRAGSKVLATSTLPC